MGRIADEYYYLRLDDNIDTLIPFLKSDERIGYLMSRDLLDNITTVTMYLDPFLKDDSILVDYFGGDPVFSLKVASIFKELKLPYLQLVPIDLQVSKSGKIAKYEYLRVCNFIRCIDIEKSNCIVDEDTDTIDSITKTVLDDESLSKVPLSDRLLFMSERELATYIYHESVVQKIQEIDTLGISFVRVEEWEEGMQFD